MIKWADISNFFDVEAETSKKNWEATMKLPIKDRIRKRKAIKDVYLDRDYKERSEEGDDIYKLTFSSNLSDFKEGDPLILHEEGKSGGMRCTLDSFEGESVIYVSVSLYERIYDMEPYYDVPLVVDRGIIDLRQNVYSRFLASLSTDKDFWTNILFNNNKEPNFEEVDDNVKDLLNNLGILSCQQEAILKSLSATDYYLIQGPPGTGKSYVLSLIIFIELITYKHKVMVIGPNHMAINNLLEKVFELYPQLTNSIDIFLKIGQSYNAVKCSREVDGELCEVQNWYGLRTPKFNSPECLWLVGLTPHSLYSRRAGTEGGLKCDTLIIDEAGQMTIPLALMGMIRAKKVILAGDHKQLPPIITSEEVPDYMKKSAFEALMTEGNYTLLDTSFRMCEPLCEYVSDIFYEGKVKSHKQGCGDLVICSDSLYSFDKPVVIHQVNDEGMQASDKEAEFIVETIVGFLKKGVPSDEIAVLAPFRAQAATVRRGIRKREDISDEDKQNLVADTVDKMQGQEREVIIYSFTAGDPDYITEMADFLYKPNKLNVAFSRAKSKLVIVGNMERIKEVAEGGYPHLIDMLNHRNVTMV